MGGNCSLAECETLAAASACEQKLPSEWKLRRDARELLGHADRALLHLHTHSPHVCD